MDKDTRNRLKALLLGLPFWGRERERAAFVADALYNHAARHSFVAEGEPATVAGELIDLCAGFEAPTEGGASPPCALLAEIRARGLAQGERGATTDTLARSLGCGTRRPTWGHDPYPGLLALDHWQAPIFFGRTAETRDLLRRLGTGPGRRFLLVTGASGAGKSSLVRAGVWAALAAGAVPELPGSRDWLIICSLPRAQRGSIASPRATPPMESKASALEEGAKAEALDSRFTS